MSESGIFKAAVKLPSEQRAAFLDSACGDNSALRQDLESLLQAHEASESFLGGLGDGRGMTGAYRPVVEQPGTVIDSYKLLQQIGEGGFGIVYMAEQEKPVRRMVALKIIKPGMDTAQVIARFESERQALAIMTHPNIATVLDAGATESGRPYFVMELVKGVPITEFCDKNHMPTEARLKLFLDVCHAIQHAHHKGIIHRDIKPSNVMVTLHDGIPVVKVIDFGVAKATVQKLTEKTLFTAYGQMIGTPAYMSPEQAEMSGLDIDTRSDVYALGVLLYELLTGTTPLETKRLREAGYAEMQRLIREEEAPRPSTRLSSLGDSATVLAGNRGLDVKRLAQLLAGDLDWLVMKALEKDRNRRYGSPGNFAEDIERFLKREAILARPPSPAYKLKKFVQRNRAAVLTTSVLALVILVGSGAVIAVQAKANRDRAAEASSRDVREAGTTASVAEAVREARERTEEAWNLHDYPERMQIATDAALAALRRADGFVASGTPTDATVADLASARQVVDELARHTRLIASCAANQRKFADDLNVAEGHPRTQLAMRHREAFKQFGLDPVQGNADEVARAVAASRLRDALLGYLLEWHVHAEYVYKMRQKFPDLVPDSPTADPIVKDRLVQVVRSARQLSGGAYARWQDLLDRKNIPGLVAFAASPDGLSFRSQLVNALARDLDHAKEYSACQTFLRAAVDRYPHDVWLQHDLYINCYSMQPPDWLEGLRHMSAASVLWPDSGYFQLQIGYCYDALGSYDLAVAAFRKAIVLYTNSAYAHMSLGETLLKKKDPDGAIAAFREAIRLDPKFAHAHFSLGLALYEQKEWEGAITAIREAVRLDPKLPQPHSRLGMALAAAGRHAEALQVLTATMRQNPDWTDDPRTHLRYNAACCALLSADGKGPNARPTERPMLRNQALDFLTAELAAFRKLAATDPKFTFEKLQHWLVDEDLATIRDPMAIKELPPGEADAWKKLWVDVRELCDRTAAKPGTQSPAK
jgi:serine/threonine protein kinase/tetratricopeptide (TPR) repeat protein